MRKLYSKIKTMLLEFDLLNRCILLVFNKVSIRGKHNVITQATRIKGCHLEINGSYNKVNVAYNAYFKDCKVVINGNSNVINVFYNSYIEKTFILIGDDDGLVSIGENNYIYKSILTANEAKKILVGDDCLISRSEVRTGDNHSIVDVTTKSRLNMSKSVVIGNHVWLGNNSMIMKGVKINNDAIVGAGSIVTKNVASNVVVVGTPARVVKQNVTWLHERI